MKTFTCTTLVWLREVAHEAGTVFEVVAAPQKPTDVELAQAEAWKRNGWGDFGKPAKAAK